MAVIINSRIKKIRRWKKKKMKKGLTMLVAAMVITGLICVIGSAAAATNIWVESNVRGVGHLTSEYEVDTEYGLANGIEMQELESGSGLVTKQKWTLEVNPIGIEYDTGAEVCLEGLIEEKEFDVEYFPITYQNHSYDQKWMEKKCVKNYDLGAVTDANFIQCEKLQKKESVVTFGNGVEMDQVWPIPANKTYVTLAAGTPSIVQTVSADVLGISHIGFAAKDPNQHHHTIAYGREETIGQFSIEKTIEIKSTCLEPQIGDWLGCP
nr:secreted protein [uncultured archaeon]